MKDKCRIVFLRWNILLIFRILWLNSLDLQDFFSRMVIVADENRLKEYEYKLEKTAFLEIKNRVKFLGYNAVVKEYEHEVLKTTQQFNL